MQVRHYFAYGSNMNPHRVADRGLAVTGALGGRLDGFELRFNKVAKAHPGQSHANIMARRGSSVEGVVYQLDSHREILKMDVFEHAPWNYGRDVVAVVTPSGSIWAWTYFANPAVLGEGLSPSQAYLDHLLAGQAYLSTEYFAALKQHPVAAHLDRV